MSSGFSPEAHQLLQKPEVQKKIFELKNSDKNLSWREITNIIKKDYGIEVSANAVLRTYRVASAVSITVEKKGAKHFNHLLDSLKERFERMLKRTQILAEAFDSLIDELETNEELNTLEKANAKLKLVDSLEKLNKIFNSQMQIVIEEIDKIKIEQKKLVYDDASIVQKINDTFPVMLQQYEDAGKIAVIDKSILE